MAGVRIFPMAPPSSCARHHRRFSLTRAWSTNPNVVGAEALPGTFNIIYKNITIGKAFSLEQGIPPLSSTVMHVSVKVDGVPGNLGLEMMREMQNSNMLLPISCTGSVTAKVGYMKVLATIRCDLVCDISVLPETRFTKKVCTYTYGLPPQKKSHRGTTS
eukprot:CAMPEP_0117621802 /NCGR_PEP_ID=MMETSP0784-20121206/87819_1 /TAXON_ID=39447 /ORGANISM="" /LENGTH=159 /DNA_ID=CAMNT_0005425733 /DNA_START=75 /DNA_END=554 /DNA_ORIENTATION=-